MKVSNCKKKKNAEYTNQCKHRLFAVIAKLNNLFICLKILNQCYIKKL